MGCALPLPLSHPLWFTVRMNTMQKMHAAQTSQSPPPRRLASFHAAPPIRPSHRHWNRAMRFASRLRRSGCGLAGPGWPRGSWRGGVANLPSPLDTAGADAGVVGVDLGVSAYSWLLMPITLAKIVGWETCRFA